MAAIHNDPIDGDDTPVLQGIELVDLEDKLERGGPTIDATSH